MFSKLTFKYVKRPAWAGRTCLSSPRARYSAWVRTVRPVAPNLSRGAEVGEVRALSLAPSAAPAAPNQQSWPDLTKFEAWRIGLRRKVLEHLSEFVSGRCAAELAESGVEVAGDILLDFVAGGKCLRSTYMYLGWLAGSADCDEALFASAGLELLHAFALLQRLAPFGNLFKGKAPAFTQSI